jgi:hypothetical protein
MEDCKAIEVPLDPNTKLKNNVNKDDDMVQVHVQQVLGSLMYAMLCTQSDLAYPINVVSQHMAKAYNIGLQLSAFFDTCRALCNSYYISEDYHPKIWSDIVMQIGSMTLRIKDPPQGLYS